MTGYLGAEARRRRAGGAVGPGGHGGSPESPAGPALGGAAPGVAVARALSNQPPLILADEPTGSLDTHAGQDLMNLLKELNRSQGVTFVIVTHDPAVARQTRRVVVMADGKIVHEDRIGSPLEEDLKMWRHSGLGQQVFAGDHERLQALGITAHQIDDVKAILGSWPRQADAYLPGELPARRQPRASTRTARSCRSQPATVRLDLKVGRRRRSRSEPAPPGRRMAGCLAHRVDLESGRGASPCTGPGRARAREGGHGADVGNGLCCQLEPHVAAGLRDGRGGPRPGRPPAHPALLQRLRHDV